MAFTINNNMISKGFLGAAVGFAAAGALAGLSNMTISERWIYIFMGSFLLFVFLHGFFRDENFDKLQAVKRTMWILLPWFAILFFYAFALGAYVAMFVSLGFFVVTYLIHLLLGILNLKEEGIN